MLRNPMDAACRMIISLAALSALSACGDDSTGVNTGDLGEEASMEIMMELMSHMSGAGFDPGDFSRLPGGSVSLMPAGPSFAETIDFSGPCAEGGTIELAGTIDDDIDAEGNGSVSMDVRQTPVDCGILTSEDVFIVNGNPNIRYTADFNFENEEPVGDASFALNGGFSWAGSGGGGTCTMNMSFTFNFDDPSVMEIDGSVCGHALSA